MSSYLRKMQKKQEKDKMNLYLENLIRDLIIFKKKTDDFLDVFKPVENSACQELKDLSEKINKEYKLS